MIHCRAHMAGCSMHNKAVWPHDANATAAAESVEVRLTNWSSHYLCPHMGPVLKTRCYWVAQFMMRCWDMWRNGCTWSWSTTCNGPSFTSGSCRCPGVYTYSLWGLTITHFVGSGCRHSQDWSCPAASCRFAAHEPAQAGSKTTIQAHSAAIVKIPLGAPRCHEALAWWADQSSAPACGFVAGTNGYPASVTNTSKHFSWAASWRHAKTRSCAWTQSRSAAKLRSCCPSRLIMHCSASLGAVGSEVPSIYSD